MRHRRFVLKVLALVVVAAFLTLRLANLSTEIFVIPVEDAIFAVAFIADETGGGSKKPPKIKIKRAIDYCHLCPAEAPPQPGERLLLQPWRPPAGTGPLDVRTEIFIPPESHA